MDGSDWTGNCDAETGEPKDMPKCKCNDDNCGDGGFGSYDDNGDGDDGDGDIAGYGGGDCGVDGADCECGWR